MKQFFLFLVIFSIILFLSIIFCNSLHLGICDFLEQYYTILGSLAIQLGLFSLGMFFLWKKNLKTTFAEIGFPGNPIKTILFTIAGLILLFGILLLLGIIATLAGFNDQQKVADKVVGLPVIVLLFAVFAAPIAEELFFRAFLVKAFDNFFLKLIKIPNTGVIFSSIFFGIAHFAYGSVVEIIGVLAIGLILASIFKISKSITPCILIHMIYNGLSIIVMKFVLGI
ncbi:MAG: type II CAAX endopeptidase family protein [Candidatus Micrarchaeota archaeon]